MEDKEIDLSELNLEETNLDNSDLESNGVEELNLSTLVIEEEPETDLESNVILDNSDKLTLGLSEEKILEFYDYLSGKTPRPIFAEKFFADGESRIRESNQLTAMMGLSFVPKLLAVEQSLIDNLCSPENLKYLSTENKLSYLQTFAAISTKFNSIAEAYIKNSKDFTGVPLVYRSLLDQLLQVSEDKLPRLKLLPKLIDLSEDTWNRIVEISNLK